jgi:OmpA-OmpF porin, OOP family
MIMLKYFLRLLLSMLFFIPLLPAIAWSDPDDFSGSKDPAIFSRMPGFYITNYRELDFNTFEFPISPGKAQTLEGHHIYIDYYAKENTKAPSGLQVTRNYANAAQSIGGSIVYEFEDGGTQYIILKVVKNDTETWAQVEGANNGMYRVNIIEMKTMRQDVVADAESMAGSILQTGKASVYGIYFDTGRSEIKPESEPSINEIVKLLKSDPSLKIYVVGHTDTVGAFDYNVKLSQARASAVVNALTSRHGIVASRLVPFGAGPTAPVASNENEDGRARNRRVDLVSH